jgi:CRP/FNR family transcriptional regulator, cyclic AMP receptor protein
MKKKILLIEDDVILRENTAEILQMANYDVITAENGKLGIDKAIVNKPDIIICDILMPELDGYGVLQIILRNNELQNTPFIFMTAVTKHSDVRKGMDMGASDYITKPFEESELLSAISSRLKRKKIFDKRDKKNAATINKVNLEHLEDEFSLKEKFKYIKGATIYCEGHNSNHIFYILNGEVKTFKNNEDGKELITGIFKSKKLFGFTSFSKNKSYDENAVAIKNTTLLKITKEEIYNLIIQNPQLAVNFMDLMSENLKNVNEHLIHLAYDSVRKKTADMLLELSKLNNNTDCIEISRLNLANLIGIAKETLIRTLKDFKEEKIIEADRNSVKILNFKKLSIIK